MYSDLNDLEVAASTSEKYKDNFGFTDRKLEDRRSVLADLRPFYVNREEG